MEGKNIHVRMGGVLVSQARPNQPKCGSLSILQMEKEGSGYTGDAQEVSMCYVAIDAATI